MKASADSAATFCPDCTLCPRLASFLAATAREFPDYHCKPVAPFGVAQPSLLIVGKVYKADIEQHLTAGKTLMFAHGFAIRFDWIVPPANVDVSMIAPKAPGHRVREVFIEGAGVPGLLAVHQDASGGARALALSYGRAIGCARAGIIETTFKEETETDSLASRRSSAAARARWSRRASRRSSRRATSRRSCTSSVSTS